jgi:hypothetical protein
MVFMARRDHSVTSGEVKYFAVWFGSAVNKGTTCLDAKYRCAQQKIMTEVDVWMA